MLESALREAERAGVTVCFGELGVWARRRLLAEYDPGSRTIVVDERVVAGVRARDGDVFAERFAAFAIWHELHHLRSGTRDERAAHAAAAARTGISAAVLERAALDLDA